MHSLELMLLGDFQAHIAPGVAANFAMRKSRALLAYLALHPGEAQGREKLAALLWSERPEKQARNSLSQALSDIRKGLGAARPFPLSIEVPQVTLVASVVETDVLRFEQLAGGDDAKDLDRAAGLYRGDLLAELGVRGPLWDGWLDSERRRLQQLYGKVLNRLLAHYEETSRHDQAVAVGERLIAHEPLLESAYRALMRIHAAAGARTLALRQFQRCQEVLRQELGVAPEPATLALHRAITSGDGRAAEPAVGSAIGEPESRSGLEPEPQPSIAVLPFENLSGDASQNYLALGLADQLVTTLGYVPWFFVSAQSASFASEISGAPKAEIGRRLGVRYLLDGALQKAGTQLKISVHLTATSNGRQIWSKAFQGDLENLFELQDNLAETVIGEIEPRLRQIEVRRSQAKHGNLSAYDFYLRALPHIRGMTRTEFDSGLSYLKKAIERNPDYAAAHGLIAWLMTLRVPQGQSQELETGIYHAEQALQRGQFDAEALSTGGYALGFLKWDPDLGLQHLWESLSLNPNSARAHDFTGWMLLYAGKATEAMEHFDHSLELSPIDDFAFRALTGKAFALLFLEQPQRAVSHAKRALAANIHFTVCHRVLAAALVQSGSLAEAREVIADLLAHHPSLTVSRYAEETRFVYPSYKAMLLNGLRRAGLPAS